MVLGFGRGELKSGEELCLPGRAEIGSFSTRKKKARQEGEAAQLEKAGRQAGEPGK